MQYYSLDVSFFKSSLDSSLLSLLWNKYWVNTLSSSPLIGNRDFVAGQISDLGNHNPPALTAKAFAVCSLAIVATRQSLRDLGLK